ncbi:hypothetical protein FB451DRAFT_245227 [Mycena latifolia]|nr:hypothetical protein FB451DRAFT_245227 [Mycena latifolia]
MSVAGLEKKDDSDIAILRAIDAKPHLFPHSVHHMYLFPVHWTFFAARPSKDAWSDRELQKVLAACASVTNLFLFGNPTTPLLQPMLEMRPRRLIMLVGIPDRAVDFSLPFFRHLTHLSLGDIDDPDGAIQPNAPQLHNLCRLPVLTHVAFMLTELAPASNMLKAILSDSRHLQALLIFGNDSTAEALAGNPTLHDQRVVILGDSDINGDWYWGIRGHPDMWARADTFIAGKRNGVIEGSRYYLEPPERPAPEDPPHVAVDVSPSASDPSTIPRLTPSLERKIFDCVGLLHPEMVPTLLLVAHRVLDWTEPLLYRKITITTQTPHSKSDLAIRRIIQLKPAQFLRDAVRHVVLKTLPWDDLQSGEGWSDADLSNVLRACTGATDLVVTGDLFNPLLLLMLSHMRPTHLSLAADLITPGQSNTPRFDRPFLQGVSHVHLFDADVCAFDSVSADWQYWSHMCELPALTHLAIPWQTSPEIIPTILAGLTNLQALILLADAFVDGEEMSRSLPVDDARVAIVQTNWALGARVGDDFWARADSFFVRKRSGEIEASCYYLKSGVKNVLYL